MKRGQQPLWLSAIMRYHIQPVAKTLGIEKHTFRYTYSTILKPNAKPEKL